MQYDTFMVHIHYILGQWQHKGYDIIIASKNALFQKMHAVRIKLLLDICTSDHNLKNHKAILLEGISESQLIKSIIHTFALLWNVFQNEYVI